MEAGSQSEGRPRPAVKTVRAVASFALLAAAAYAGVALLGGGEGPGASISGSSAHLRAVPAALPPGPLPAAVRDRARVEPEPMTVLPEGGLVPDPHRAIEDPGGDAMRRFHEALLGLDRGDDRKVRIAHYGDSILTTDLISGQVRRILQRRFGDGGHGFVLLGKPWRWYGHLDVEHGSKGKWRARPLTSDPVRDGLYGLGGVAFETSREGAVAWAGTSDEGPVGSRVASFDVSYLERPRGGSLDLIVDGRLVQTASTDADAVREAHRVVEVPPGPARLEVRARGDGPVRLFGAVLETDGPGIVYDSLAINGARASVLGRFDEEHWARELRRRLPDLVVLMFGANEGHNEWLALGEYQGHLAEVLRAIRRALPESSVLVVGPLDQAERLADGSIEPRDMPGKLSRVQREVALAEGCAFFDSYAAMGGKGSMAGWFQRGLGGGDLVHPTEHGARRLGNWIAQALFAGYSEYARSRADGGQIER